MWPWSHARPFKTLTTRLISYRRILELIDSSRRNFFFLNEKCFKPQCLKHLDTNITETASNELPHRYYINKCKTMSFTLVLPQYPSIFYLLLLCILLQSDSYCSYLCTPVQCNSSNNDWMLTSALAHLAAGLCSAGARSSLRSEYPLGYWEGSVPPSPVAHRFSSRWQRTEMGQRHSPANRLHRPLHLIEKTWLYILIYIMLLPKKHAARFTAFILLPQIHWQL